MTQIYNTGWKKGKWLTNANDDEFEDVFIWGRPSKIERMLDKNFSRHENEKPRIDRVKGPPKQGRRSVEELEDMGLVGVYIVNELSQREIISKHIRQTWRNEYGQICNFFGNGWRLELDKRRMSEYTVEEYGTCMCVIADFIEDGLTQGITPYWKLHQEA